MQYVEMIGTADNEQAVNGFTITEGANTFTFVGNLPSALTNGKWMLIATTTFATLPGAPPPDYTLPDNFFPTSGGTLRYDTTADIWAYGAVPTDGTLALARDGSTPTNSPTNFAGASGSVTAASSVPTLAAWAIVLLVGALLLVASGLLRRRATAL